jgi:hypothetical protein
VRTRKLLKYPQLGIENCLERFLLEVPTLALKVSMLCSGKTVFQGCDQQVGSAPSDCKEDVMRSEEDVIKIKGVLSLVAVRVAECTHLRCRRVPSRSNFSLGHARTERLSTCVASAGKSGAAEFAPGAVDGESVDHTDTRRIPNSWFVLRDVCEAMLMSRVDRGRGNPPDGVADGPWSLVLYDTDQVSACFCPELARDVSICRGSRRIERVRKGEYGERDCLYQGAASECAFVYALQDW